MNKFLNIFKKKINYSNSIIVVKRKVVPLTLQKHKNKDVIKKNESLKGISMANHKTIISEPLPSGKRLIFNGTSRKDKHKNDVYSKSIIEYGEPDNEIDLKPNVSNKTKKVIIIHSKVVVVDEKDFYKLETKFTKGSKQIEFDGKVYPNIKLKENTFNSQIKHRSKNKEFFYINLNKEEDEINDYISKVHFETSNQVIGIEDKVDPTDLSKYKIPKSDILPDKFTLIDSYKK